MCRRSRSKPYSSATRSSMMRPWSDCPTSTGLRPSRLSSSCKRRTAFDEDEPDRRCAKTTWRRTRSRRASSSSTGCRATSRGKWSSGTLRDGKSGRAYDEVLVFDNGRHPRRRMGIGAGILTATWKRPGSPNSSASRWHTKVNVGVTVPTLVATVSSTTRS